MSCIPNPTTAQLNRADAFDVLARCEAFMSSIQRHLNHIDELAGGDPGTAVERAVAVEAVLALAAANVDYVA